MMFRVSQVASGGSGASLVVTCSSDFAGATITASKSGSTTQTQTCPLSSPYVVTFSGLDNGTWTISGTVSGQSYSVQATITDFSAVLSAGFNWQGWVDASVDLDSTDYNDLDEVLADEKAVRELMLVHACVDFLAASNVDSDVEKIINNDICAKWINLCDYSLDTLYAVTDIASAMDTADKYYYGEWTIVDDTTTPATWGPKGCVPKMTSNTAPYGEASASSAYSGGEAYRAFNGNTNDSWITSNASTSFSNIYVQYKFTNPLMAKKAYIKWGSAISTLSAKIQGSNSGNSDDWNDLASISDASQTDYELNNSEYYLYYRLFITSQTLSANVSGGRVEELQFYGRQLSVSVPVMTSNTAPFGEASASSEYQNNNAYKAFDGVDDINDYWSANTSTNESITYEFPEPVQLLGFKIHPVYMSSELRVRNFKLQGSNDGTTFTDLGSYAFTSNADSTMEQFLSVNTKYKYARIFVIDTFGSNYIRIQYLQFYGLDYSEKEFEQGTTKKWLYDHGVELETLTSGGSGTATKGDSALHIEVSATASITSFFMAQLDLTPYELYRGKVGDVLEGANTFNFGLYSTLPSTPTTAAAASNYAGGNTALPNNINLDISAYDQTYYIGIEMQNGSSGPVAKKAEITELWLEP